MLLVQLSVAFQSLPPLPTSKLGPSGADSWVGGFLYILGPCGSLLKLSCEAGSFSCYPNPHRFFQSEVLRFYFPVLEPWCGLSGSPVVPPFYPHANVGLPTPAAATLLLVLSTPAACVHPSYQSG